MECRPVVEKGNYFRAATFRGIISSAIVIEIVLDIDVGPSLEEKWNYDCVASHNRPY
jgi:hypothetical protein